MESAALVDTIDFFRLDANRKLGPGTTLEIRAVYDAACNRSADGFDVSGFGDFALRKARFPAIFE